MALSKWMYDVYLSYREEDTRLGFTGHLYKALADKGIRTTFSERGEEISNTIEESKIFIVVFSENYASSSFCLNELVHIIESHRTKRRSVIPVFYKVDPTYVRHQMGSYGEALAMHEKSNSNQIMKWRNALQQASSFSGWTYRDGYEYEFIEKIVDYISKEINRVPLSVPDHPVGLEYRMLEINWLLDAESDVGVRTIGIWGMGGIGKTTLAHAIYNSIAGQFDGCCFLGDVRQNAMRHGLVHLQETLLAELVGENDIQLQSVSQRVPLIQRLLRKKKKFLIVLDDVNESEQLKALVGRSDLLGPGSRVIITTRDEDLLTSHGVEKIYEVEKLTKGEALELLCWKAFQSDKVYPDYVDILYRAATYAAGLPLALEVIGSNLFKRGIEESESTLDLYQKIPDGGILKLLKVSFDALDEHEKEVFLDIACFFKGSKLAEVDYILGAHHGYCLKSHMEVLLERSLIKIDVHDCVMMHDLIQDMGREIVRQESPQHPGNRSRLWSTHDIVNVLEENMGTCSIQMIILDFPKPKEVVQWDRKAFAKMTRLRTLIIRNECFSEGPKTLPNSLIVLEWQGYPSKSLPYDFQPENLVMLKLPSSRLLSLKLPNYSSLKALNFDACRFIRKIPDLSGAPNLNELSFADCENLVEIDKSVGFLHKLEIMNFEGCRKLWTFPPINLTSLEHINLSYCSRLLSFPEILGKMENITHLSLKYTAIRELPYSIGKLIQLQSLELHSCGIVQLPSSLANLSKLEVLSIGQCEGLQPSKQEKDVENESIMELSSNVKRIYFGSCNISDEFIQIGLAWFANVTMLDLSGNNFTILPSCIKECCLLKKLNLDYCIHLREIGGIPPNLETLSAIRCTSLKDLDLTVLLASTKEHCFLRELVLDECENLQEIRGIPPNIEYLSAINCRSLTASCRKMLLSQELHESGNKRFCLPASRIPAWFEHCSRGRSISFWYRNKFPVISLCLVGLMHKYPIEFSPTVIINGKIMKTKFQIKRFYFVFPVLTDHILTLGERQIKFEDEVGEVLLESEWNHVVVSIDIDFKWNPTEPFTVQTGLHVIKQKSSMDDILFTDPYKQMGVLQREFEQLPNELMSYDLLQPHLTWGRG